MNDMSNVPAGACGKCGGWTSFGGMSQYAGCADPVHGRTGCTCTFKLAEAKEAAETEENPNASTPIVNHAGRDLFDQMATEMYYGFNLRLVLSQATVAERGVIRKLMVRAAVARQGKPQS